MTRAGSWRGYLAALGIYSALAIGFIDHGVSITDNVSGSGTDPFIFIWFMAWWPYALAHHLSPFVTHLMWQPLGVSIPWVTSVPALSLAMVPFTILAGPVLSYNLITIAAPVLDAWCVFILCRVLTGGFTPSLFGGLFYGFSSYVMAQDISAPNLCFAVCPPLLMLVVWLRLRGALTRPAAILSAAGLLAVQFFISIEVAALTLVFGGIAWALALRYCQPYRPALLSLVKDGLAVGLLLAICLGPDLVYMQMSRRMLHLPRAWPFYFTADAVNIFVPSRHNLAGSLWPFPLPPFNGELHEQDAYLGVPLVVIIAMIARSQADKRWLVIFLLCVSVASLGPFLWVAGWFSKLALPWVAFSSLPVLGDALPTRFALFVDLAAAVLVALWLSNGPRWRYALASLAFILVLPAPQPWEPIPTLTFFAPGRVQAVLGPRPQLLILPFAINGPSSYWQVESHFAFTQTGGYIGFPPGPMQSYAAVPELFGQRMGPTFPADVAHFAGATGAQFIILAPGTAPTMAAALGVLGWPTRNVDDVTVLTVPHGE